MFKLHHFAGTNPEMALYFPRSHSFLYDGADRDRKVPVDLNRTLPTIFQSRTSNRPRVFLRNLMKLYVGNLSYSVNDSTLKSLFEPFGNVESARVISDRDTGSSKGFGFVEMSDEDAKKAMGALNGREQDGRALKVNEAKPQENRGGGGGFGGGRNRY